MRILFVGHNRIGDAVLSSGLLSRLSQLHPEARFCLVCGPLPAPLFAGMPNSTVLPLAKRRLRLHWLAVWARVVTERWDLLVDLRNSALARTVRAGRRYIVPRPMPNEHKVLQMARTMGWDDDPPAPELWTTPEADAAAARLIPQGGPVLALGPTANWPGKIWAADRFVELARRLTAHDGPMSGARIAVFGSEHEYGLAKPVLTGLAGLHVIDLVGRANLLTAFACLGRCSLYVGNDSGLMHTAAAAGIPTLGLFGPSRTEHYAPWGGRSAFVRTAERFDELISQPGYDHRKTGSLMGSLDVITVATATEMLWRKCYGEVA